MKRMIWMMLLLLVLSLLVACGGENTATTLHDTTPTPLLTTPTQTAPHTTEPVSLPTTSAPTTTSAVETTEVPIVIEPVSISFSMGQSGYLMTEFDEEGRVAIRCLYDRDTMQKTGKTYRYTYDDGGKLIDFVIAQPDSVTEYSLAYSEDGKTVTATDKQDETSQYVIVFGDDGEIVSETVMRNGEAAFRFEYNAEGLLELEIMYFRGMGIEYETWYNEDMALITCVLENAATELCVTYNEAGYPISLEGQQLSNDYWYVYTYNARMQCVSANFIDVGNEFYYEFTYEGDLLIKLDKEDYSGKVIEEYTYDEKGVLVKTVISRYDTLGKLLDQETVEHTA